MRGENMEGKVIQSVNYNPQDYLEVVMSQPLQLKTHAYFLGIEHYLNCFIHVGIPSILYFDTQYVTSFKHYLMHNTLSKNELKEWLLFLVEEFESEAEGLILWNLDYIFVDEKSKKMILCKIPQIQEEKKPSIFSDLLMQMYELMNYVGDEEWISQMYLIIKSKPFKISLFKQFLTSKKNKKWISIFKKESDDLDDFFQMIQVKESQPTYGIATTPFETQILMAGFQYGYLVDERQSQFFISSTPFLVGRNKDCHCVQNFPEISKVHCIIHIENGLCFIEDQASTNGTQLNQERLLAYHKVQLKNEDVITLAGHKLIYYV